MKSKIDEKKLNLKKSTVANLEDKEMRTAVGGDFTYKGLICEYSISLCSLLCPPDTQ